MVHIKNIRMTGFKSFGNGTKSINLNSGFTCIVGPNGSGKSNAIDAISFCLGTLSKKSMRAEKLTDLLYSGGKGKKPAETAIIEIELDNSDFKIPVKEKSVRISRELKRSGSSIYRMNGKRATRSDILDKLRIAGIDCVDGYNIIQQGQIGEIVGMSGIQRRELLEGVAGIRQFEEQKEEAIAELGEAQKKIGELDLLIDEITQRVNQLRKEKQSAERHIEAGEKIRTLQSTILSSRLLQTQQGITSLNGRVNDQNIIIKELEKSKVSLIEIQELEEKLLNKQQEFENFNQRQKDDLQNLNIAKIQLAKLEGRKEFFSEKEEQNQHDLNRIDYDLDSIKKMIEDRGRTVHELIDKIQSLENQRKSLILERTEVEESIKEKEKESYEVEENHERIKKELTEIHEEMTALEVSDEISTSVVESFKESNVTKTKESLEVQKEIDKTVEKIESTKNEIDKATKEYEELKDGVSIYHESAEKQQNKIKSSEIFIREQSDEVLVLKTKIDLIKTSISVEEEGNPALKYILKNKEAFPGIIGTVESSLGGVEEIPTNLMHFKNVVLTQDTQTVLNCIWKLKSEYIGSCKFLPLDRLEIEKSQLAEEIETKFFSSFMVAEDLNIALDLWMEDKTMQVQTFAGDIFHSNGVIEGGFFLSNAECELDTLIEKKKSLEESIEKQNNEKKMQEDVLHRILKAIEISEESTLKIDLNTRDLIIHLQHLSETKNQKKNDLEKIEKELKDIEKAELEKNFELGNIRQKIKEKQLKKKSIEETLEESFSVLKTLDSSNLKSRRSNINDKIFNIEKEKIRCEERKKGIDDSVKSSEEQRNTLIQAKNDLKSQIHLLNEEKTTLATDIKETMTSNSEMGTDVNQWTERTKMIKTDIQLLNKEVKKKNRQNSRINKDILASKDEINLVKIERARLETEYASVINEIKDKQLDLMEISIEESKKVDPNKLQEKIKEFKDQQKNLEPINMRSIEDFGEQDKRRKKTKIMRKMLSQERKVILDLIVQLEIEKSNTFMKTFNKINSAFDSIFHELADGTAKLILENREDIFSGGVGMVAHPAGKRVKTLESMSGGEKALTALAFIFAIQQTEPQPFYILDEIDAALDVKNVDKVSRLISRMSKGTSKLGYAQFLVISHRDVLMAKADSIYGTTNVNGITQIIQLQLEENKLVQQSS